jgi:glycosyltransferase involved in cell wall biosynthesis
MQAVAGNTKTSTRPRVVHLPFEEGNPYQPRLLEELGKLGIDAIGRRMPRNLMHRTVREWNADTLHFHWLSAETFGRSLAGRWRLLRFLGSVFLLRRRGVRIVWTIHNLGHHEQTDPRAERAFLKRMCAASDACIVHSNSALAAVLGELGPSSKALRDRFHVIAHGNYDGCYPAMRPPDTARASLHVPQDSFVAAFVGLLRPYKNAEGLVAAFRAAGLANSRLLVCGKPMSEAHAAQIERCIGGHPDILCSLRRLSDEEISDRFAAADVVVLPYTEALTSGAAILAMTMGRPVIAPRLGCFAEIVGDTAGILYDASEPDGLLRALREAASDRARLRALGATAREKAAALGWDKIAAQCARLYGARTPGADGAPVQRS